MVNPKDVRIWHAYPRQPGRVYYLHGRVYNLQQRRAWWRLALYPHAIGPYVLGPTGRLTETC